MKIRSWLTTLTFAAFMFLLGFTYEFHWPRIKTWLLVEIESLSQKYLPVRILAQDLQISFSGISLVQLKLLPQGELANSLAPISVKKITFSPNFFGIVSGNLGLTHISIEQPEVTIILKKALSTTLQDQRSNSSTIRDFLRFPIGELTFSRMLLQARLDDRDILTQLADVDLSIRAGISGALIELRTPKITVKKRGTPAKLALALETRLALKANSLQVSALHLKKGRSYILSSGSISGDLDIPRVDMSDFAARGFFDLGEIQTWFSEILPELNIPQISGEFTIDSSYKKIGTSPPDFKIKGDSNDLTAKGFIIGEVGFAGRSDGKFFSIPEVKVQNSAGLAKIKNILFNTDSRKRLEAEVQIETIELNRLLENLKLPGVPVQLFLSGNLPCSVDWELRPVIKCTGTVNGKNLLVRSRMENGSTIVEVESLRAKGDLEVTTEMVKYSADLTVAPEQPNPSSGKSEGVIIYDEGFSITYSADALYSSHIKNLANLKLEGSTKLSGQTTGDSSAAKFDMRLGTSSFWFEDFFFGTFQTHLSYESGYLRFKKVVGTQGDSRYQGDLSLNLDKEQLSVNANFPTLSAKDIQHTFSRITHLPMQITGTGHARIKAEGPLALNRLSYDAEMQLTRGSIGLESFNELHLAVKSKSGHAVIQKGLLTKENSSIQVFGEGWPNGNILCDIKGHDFLIEDSETAKTLGLKLKGNISFDSQLSGHIRAPAAILSATLTNTAIGNDLFPDSKLHLYVDTDKLSATGNFFGDKISTEIDLPLSPEYSFRLLGQMNDWNFVPVLALFNPEIEKLNFRSNVKAHLLLQAPSNDIWKSSGSISLNDFMFFRDEIGLKTKAPLKIEVKDGIANSENLTLEGPKAFISTQFKNFSESSMVSQTNSKIDLALLAFATPFLDDIGGSLSIAFKSGGNKNKPEILGSAFVENGYFKIPEFPNPIEDLKADLLFSQSKFLINSLNAQINGGAVQMDGSISFDGVKNFPTDIRMNVKDEELNYTANVTTKGSAKLRLSRNWFPFLLAGQVDIEKSLVTRELSDFSDSKTNIRESPFLPTLFIKTESKLMELNLDVAIQKSIAIKNSTLDTEFKGSLAISGHVLEPEIKGTLQAQSGQLFFRKTPFNINEATVTFKGGKKINPSLYFVADTRIDTRDKDFDVSFLLQGTGEKPEITLSSQPNLPNQEIISLLALGVTSSDLENTQDSYQARSTALIGLSQGLSREIKDKFGLNLQVSQDVSQSEAVQKITISKEFFTKFAAAASKSVGTDEIDVKLEYKVNKNFSLIGSWESFGSSETNDITAEAEKDSSKLGLDLELKFEFK